MYINIIDMKYDISSNNSKKSNFKKWGLVQSYK